MDYTPECPVTLEYVPPFAPIGFGFRLSGCSQVYSSGQKKGKDIGPGHAGFNCFKDLVDLTETVDMERVVHISILMDLKRFYAFSEGETKGLPSQLENLPNRAFCHKGQITPAMRATIFHIFNCPYQGWAKTFFLESKALELIAHKIEQIEYVDNQKPGTGHLPAPDLNRIREAAHLLAGDLETSPDLNQLARSVGMCRSKLHRCFRIVYGVTPFEYLRNRRLETAMDFLMDGQMNVTQAAYAVGYSSPSYFTKAFKKYFGCLPSENFY
ncbi:helix-turn-helix transcriptional regulator [Desulfobacter curvatus]|uniref:helix-turn-helix transcriptional regulator n=1 Tax=Desulfobacter curvatus TaxID=2290 RepID=UPI0012FC6C41|nr:AraC family transcriptional regulator [Desulfobacter curvatus]